MLLTCTPLLLPATGWGLPFWGTHPSHPVPLFGVGGKAEVEGFRFQSREKVCGSHVWGT